MNTKQLTEITDTTKVLFNGKIFQGPVEVGECPANQFLDGVRRACLLIKQKKEDNWRIKCAFNGTAANFFLKVPFTDLLEVTD